MQLPWLSLFHLRFHQDSPYIRISPTMAAGVTDRRWKRGRFDSPFGVQRVEESRTSVVSFAPPRMSVPKPIETLLQCRTYSFASREDEIIKRPGLESGFSAPNGNLIPKAGFPGCPVACDPISRQGMKTHDLSIPTSLCHGFPPLQREGARRKAIGALSLIKDSVVRRVFATNLGGSGTVQNSA